MTFSVTAASGLSLAQRGQAALDGRQDAGTRQKTSGSHAQLIDVGFDVLARDTPDDGNRVGFREIA